MTRLPYGTFKTLTPEQQREHMRMLQKRTRDKNRKKINERNKEYFERWKIEKPFICTCKWCGKQFNAPRNNRYVCPDCHHKKSMSTLEKRAGVYMKRTMKAYRDKQVLKLARQKWPQEYIAKEFGISQRLVSAICLRNGLRRNEYISRIKK